MPENKFIILKIVLRPITVPLRRWVKYDKWRDVANYVKGVSSAYEAFPGGLIKTENSSGGILVRVIELAKKHHQTGSWLLVSEPDSTPMKLKEAWFERHQEELPEIVSIEEILQSSWSSQQFSYDLCRFPIMTDPPQYSVVIHQSLLEHVVDPVSVIRNLNEFLVPGGVQVIQTVNIYASEHRYPIDTLRFFPDFFQNLSKYLDLDCVECFFENQSIYAVLRRRMKNTSHNEI